MTAERREPSEPTAAGLGKKVARGMRSTGASLVGVTSIQLLHLALLARILGPAEMGGVSAVMIVTGLLDILSDLGFSNATIQRQLVSRAGMSTLYWLNVLCGLLISLSLYALSGPISNGLGNSSVQVLFQLAAVTYLVVPHGQQSRAVLERNLRFAPLAVGDVCAALIGAGLSVALALAGIGAICFVVGSIAAAITRVVVARLTARRLFVPEFSFSLKSVRGSIRFGLLQLADAVVSYVGANAASTAIAGQIGLRQLAGYNLASNAVVNTPAKINPVLTRVMFPTFSLIQNDRPRIGRAFERLTVSAALVNVPILALAACYSEDIVAVLFGPKWSWIVPVWIVLCGVGVLRALGNPMGILLLSLNRMGVGLGLNVFKTIVIVILVTVGAGTGGVLGAALGLLIGQALSVPLNAEILFRLTGVARTSYWLSCVFVPVLLAPSVVIWTLPRLFSLGSWGIVVDVSLGAVGSLLFLLFVWRSRFAALREILVAAGVRSSSR